MGFCLIYAALAHLVSKRMPEERYALGLFYATSLTFAILMIPFQFGIRWTSMGLLLEGVILILYGLKVKEKRLEKAGLLIFGLCIGAFYLLTGCPSSCATARRSSSLNISLSSLGWSEFPEYIC